MKHKRLSFGDEMFRQSSEAMLFLSFNIRKLEKNRHV